MDIRHIHIIYSILAEALESGYEKGLQSLRTPRRAVKFGKEMFDVNWTEADRLMLERFRMEAFLVAGVGTYELEEKLKELASRRMKGELDAMDWELEARRAMMEYGIGLGEQPPSGWIQTNIDTAITGSLNAARWQRLNDPSIRKVYPAMMYRTQRDGRVRAEHAALDGKVFRVSDAVWAKIYPPNGWRCRCYVEPLTVDDAEMKDLETTTPDSRKEYADKVQEDFKHNSGQDGSVWGRWLKMKLKGMPENVQEELQKKVRQEWQT